MFALMNEQKDPFKPSGNMANTAPFQPVEDEETNQLLAQIAQLQEQLSE